MFPRLCGLLFLVLLSLRLEAQLPAAPSEGWKTKVFCLPPDFFSASDPTSKEGARKLQDGVKLLPSTPGWPDTYDVRELLEKSGLTFPPGAEALYLTNGSLLVIRGPQDTIDLALVVFTGCGIGLPTVTRLSFSVVEFDALDEDTVRASDFNYAGLRAKAANSWKEVGTLVLLAKSGQKAVGGYVTTAPGVPAGGAPAEPETSDSLKPGETGFHVEVETVTEPDGQACDLALVCRYRMRPSDAAVSLSTTLTAWEDYPVILQLTPAPPQAEGKPPYPRRQCALILTTNMVNYGGWRLPMLKRPLPGAAR